MSTRRVDINVRIAEAAAEFRHKAVRALNALDVVNKYNFDLRTLSHQDGLDYLKQTVDVSKKTKSELYKAKVALDDLMFNLNHFITKNAQDVQKVQDRINDETRDD